MLSFLATLGMAAVGLWVLLFCAGLALTFWRELAATAAAIVAIGALGIAGVFFLVERADHKAAEQRAQKQFESDVRTARRQDERDKLRAKLEHEWGDRSAQCIAEPLLRAPCNPAQFAVARMRAFHAAELPSPRNPPPNMDVAVQDGIRWDSNLGEFRFGDTLIYLEDLAQAVDNRGAVGAQDLRGKSKDDEYRRLDQKGSDARDRIRARMNEKSR